MFNFIITLLCAIQLAKGQLSTEIQQQLKDLANREIKKQIVNGSDNKSANLSQQTQKSLMAIVQAGQILSYLNEDSSQKEKICKWVSDSDVNLPNHSTDTVFYKAESLRLFKCQASQINVIPDIKKILDQPTTVLSTINDYYSAYMINKRAKHYGAEGYEPGSTEFYKNLVLKFDTEWIDGFDSETFQLKGAEGVTGVTFESLKLLEMMATSQKDKTIGTRIQGVLKTALKKLISQASSMSPDEFSEHRFFFVAPQNAKHSNFDLAGLNLHVLNTIIEVKRGMKLSEIGFVDEYFSLYKNYFESKAASALSLQTAYYALRGLKSQADQVFLKDTWKSVLTADGTEDQIKYDVIGPMGGFGQVKAIRKATIIQINNGKVTDATSLINLIGEGNKHVVVAFEPAQIADLAWTSHLIMFEFEGMSGGLVQINKTFEVKTTIVQEIGVSVAQKSESSAPDHYQFDGGYPREFNPLNTNDNQYLHMQIQTVFFGDSDMEDHPQSVYITLQRDEENIPYTVHSDFIPSIKRYQVFVDLKLLMKEQINGDYSLKVHVEDPRAAMSYVKNLGTFQINFNEGSQDGTNLGIRDDYVLYDLITNYFPPEPPAKNPMIPLLFCGILCFMFFIFFVQLYSNGANFGNLSFFGLLFTVNYAAVLLFIAAFWIGNFGSFKLNLVKSLWALAAAAPLTLFLMNKGLTPENCFVSGFQKPSTSKGKKEN